MTLIVHHLGISQSERIPFLCEELEIPYTLIKHIRDPFFSPQSLKEVQGNPTGKAPYIQDTENGVELSESGAIVDYILAMHAASNGAKSTKLSRTYGDKDYASYIYWFHFANAGLQPAMADAMFFDLSALPEGDQTKLWLYGRLHAALKHVDERLAKTKWLAGDGFTAADVMTVYSLTTQRYFGPLVSYEQYPNIARYLADIGERPGYKRAMQKADPDMKPLLGAEAPKKSIAEDGCVASSIWRK